MPELRKDPITQRWVIIATERGKRPLDFAATPPDAEGAGCPFCPGQEAKTPPEIFAFRDPHSGANTAGWLVRVVPNKFPALRIEGDLGKEGSGIFDKMNGIGAHEVIIEATDHNTTLDQQSVEHISKAIETYKMRMQDLMRDMRFRYILIFKNHGRTAGASLSHPHSQLIATPVTPISVKEELDGAKNYFDYKDRSVFEDILRQELKEGTRLVYENAGFVSYCPFASRFPFEICVHPRRSSPDFHSITPNEILTLADCLKVTLSKLAKALNKPHYNYIIHTAPARHPRRGYWDTLDQDFCWHIEIMPRLTQVAGFEWGSGFYINPTVPEEAAKYLREISS